MSAGTVPTEDGASSATHPHAALLRRGKEAFLKRDMETITKLLAEDFVVHTSGDGAFEREYRGRDAFFRFIGHLGQLADTYQQEIHDIVASDDHSVVLVTNRAERNGRSIEYRSAEIYHIEDGQATEAWFLNDNPEPEFWS